MKQKCLLSDSALTCGEVLLLLEQCSHLTGGSHLIDNGVGDCSAVPVALKLVFYTISYTDE